MKKVLILIAALTISASLFAQDYEKAIGIRFGGNASLNYKKFISSSNAVQVDLGLNNLLGDGGMSLLVSGTYLWHWDTQVQGLSLYAGPGASVGLRLGEASGLALSIDGLAGIEYKIASLPIALSLDYRPQINLIPGFGFYAMGIALGVKYTF